MGLSEKTNEVMQKVAEFERNTNAVCDEHVNRINHLLDKLEKVVNMSGTKSTQWVEIQSEKLLKKISDNVNSLITTTDNMNKGLIEWYNKAMKTTKRSTIKSTYAKLGQTLTNDAADALADAIPNPSIEPYLPSVKLDLEIPDLSNMSEVGQISIPRLEI